MTSLKDAHAALLRDPALQFDFPPGLPDPPGPGPWRFGAGAAGVDLVWAAAILGAVAIAALAIRAVRNRVKPEAAPAAAAAAPASRAFVAPGLARAALGDADALAAAGRFLEAAHVLLACGVAAIGRHHPGLMRPTDTSRDIARLPGLPEVIRRAFATIAAAVELGVFGGRTVGEGDYARCRAAFVGSALARDG